ESWPIDGINRGLNPDELVLLTSAYGEKTRVTVNALVIPLSESDFPVRVGQEHSATAGESGNGQTVPVIPQGGAVLVASGRSMAWKRGSRTRNSLPGDTRGLRPAELQTGSCCS